MSKKLPQGWKAVKLGDIFTITSGGTPSRKNSKYYEDGNIPWVKTGDLKQKYIDYSSEYITEEAVKNSSAKYFPKDTVLIAMYGATIGATSILRIGATTNQACAAFLPNNIVLPEYLYYYFRRNKENIINLGVGGAQPNISITILKNIIIDIPPIDEQKRIISILEKSESAIEKRDESLKMIDELVKSRFIEMFGDPVKNTKGFEVVKLLNISESFIGLTYKPENVCDEGTLVLRSGNIQNSKLVFNDNVRVNTKVREKLFVKENDILMCSRNGSARLVGKVAMIPKLDEEVTFGAFMTIIRSSNYSYLFTYFQLEAFRQQLQSAKTTTINQITKKMLDEIELPLPPRELQNQFADFVKQADKLKFEIILPNLNKKCLMNNYKTIL